MLIQSWVVFFLAGEREREKIDGCGGGEKARPLSCVFSDADETKAGRSCPLVCSSPTLSEHHSPCSATHKKLMRDEGWEGARLGPRQDWKFFFAKDTMPYSSACFSSLFPADASLARSSLLSARFSFASSSRTRAMPSTRSDTSPSRTRRFWMGSPAWRSVSFPTRCVEKVLVFFFFKLSCPFGAAPSGRKNMARNFF